MIEESLDIELFLEGVVLRSFVGREWMLCWGSFLGVFIFLSLEFLFFRIGFIFFVGFFFREELVYWVVF